MAVVAVLALIAALGGFARSDHPIAEYLPGSRIELGRFAFTVHSARLIDHDEEGEPFDEEPLRVLVDSTVENISDESGILGEKLVGLDDGADDWFGLDYESTVLLHPGLPRRLELVLPATEASLGADPTKITVWLGEEKYGWTNLLNSGPEWSVPNWAATVSDVPLADERGRR